MSLRFVSSSHVTCQTANVVAAADVSTCKETATLGRCRYWPLPAGSIHPWSFDWVFNVKPLTVERTLLEEISLAPSPGPVWVCTKLMSTLSVLIRKETPGRILERTSTGGLALIHWLTTWYCQLIIQPCVYWGSMSRSIFYWPPTANNSFRCNNAATLSQCGNGHSSRRRAFHFLHFSAICRKFWTQDQRDPVDGFGIDLMAKCCGSQSVELHPIGCREVDVAVRFTSRGGGSCAANSGAFFEPTKMFGKYRSRERNVFRDRSRWHRDSTLDCCSAAPSPKYTKPPQTQRSATVPWIQLFHDPNSCHRLGNYHKFTFVD